MNILFVYSNNIDPHSGGVQRITNSLGNYLCEKGHKAYYLSTHSKSNRENSFSLPNIRYTLSQENNTFLIELLGSLKINVIINQSGISRPISELLNSVRLHCNVKIITCIHNAIFGGTSNFGITHKKILRRYHLEWSVPIFSLRLIKKLFESLYIWKNRNHYKAILLQSDYVVLLSETMKKEFQLMVGKNAVDKVVIIPNFIEYPLLYTDKKENKVVYVGRIDTTYKRTDLVVEIWKKVFLAFPDWSLHIIGEGEDFDLIKNMVNSMKVKNVVFEGKKDPISYYQKASILMMTSCSESFGLVLPESMSYGVVPIAFDAFENIHDIIDDMKSGCLVPPFDIQAYSETLTDLMTSTTFRSELSNAARLKSSKFYKSDIALLWEKVICQ